MTVFRQYRRDEAAAIEAMFVAVFTDSEGEQEGRIVSELAKRFMSGDEQQDIKGFVAEDDGKILGAIFFSRLTFAIDIDVFVLGPVGVDSAHQGAGIGQSLINHGLNELRAQGVEYVITYGDPAYYFRVGFQPVSQQAFPPPHALSQPEGWLGQTLGLETVASIPGPSRCVHALDNPAYW